MADSECNQNARDFALRPKEIRLPQAGLLLTRKDTRRQQVHQQHMRKGIRAMPAWIQLMRKEATHSPRELYLTQKGI